MKNITGVISVALVALGAVAAGAGCRKKSEGDPRCRLFERDPASQDDESVLGEMKAAYENSMLMVECAQAAGKSLEEWREELRIEERLKETGRRLESLGRTIIDEAKRTAGQVKDEARRALDKGMERAEEGLRHLDEMVGR